MSTIINNPGGNKDNADASGGSGVIIGAVLVVIVLIVVVMLALPYVREKVDDISNVENPTINVELPAEAIPSAETIPE